MRLVLDTNVVMSGVFFGGVPQRILRACVDGRFETLISPAIWVEYERVAELLAARYPGTKIFEILGILGAQATITADVDFLQPVCVDPDDDKFLG